MIAFDTNAIIRMSVEDDEAQARIVRNVISEIESQSGQILILSEVLIETVWVLESVYSCTRGEIAEFLEMLLQTPVFLLKDQSAILAAVSQYKTGGDFADLVIVNTSKSLRAKQVLSFDKKLQTRFPGYVADFASICGEAPNI